MNNKNGRLFQRFLVRKFEAEPGNQHFFNTNPDNSDAASPWIAFQKLGFNLPNLILQICKPRLRKAR
jgi:hypothetical protein